MSGSSEAEIESEVGRFDSLVGGQENRYTWSGGWKGGRILHEMGVFFKCLKRGKVGYALGA